MPLSARMWRLVLTGLPEQHPARVCGTVHNVPSKKTNEATEIFDRLLSIWSGDLPPEDVRSVVTDDYVGHVLHLGATADRTADEYASRIAEYRRDNPGARFEVIQQGRCEDRLWTRLVAVRSDGRVSHGMNESRIRGGKLAEEWALWTAWHEGGVHAAVSSFPESQGPTATNG
jgi:hypothetical protein